MSSSGTRGNPEDQGGPAAGSAPTIERAPNGTERQSKSAPDGLGGVSVDLVSFAEVSAKITALTARMDDVEGTLAHHSSLLINFCS